MATYNDMNMMSDTSAPKEGEGCEEPAWWSKLIAEFIGTFFLVLTAAFVTTNGQAEKHFAALAIGAMIMAMVFAGGHISGGHYNPAVSLGVWVRQKMKLGLMIAYIVVQLVGGTAAALIAYELTEQAAAPTRSVSNFRAVTIEALFTFALVTVMLNCATTKSQDGNSFYGLAIGFTVTGGGFAAGPYTGGVFNPAVGTALIFAQAVHPLDNDGNDDLHLGAGFWIYWVGPCVGGLLAGLMFMLMNRREFKTLKPSLELGWRD